MKVSNAMLGSIIAIFMVMVGAGVANAAPGDWANAPGYVAPHSSGQPAGTLVNSEEVPTPEGVNVPSKAYVLTYEDGTGQKTKEVLIVPESDYDGVRPVLTNVAPTDSLDPAMAPSRQLFKEKNGMDMSVTNKWLEGGGSVLIPDSYGDQNPTYAGMGNGVRIKNGMLAAQSFTGQNNPMSCAGFSGGGLDCGRVAEDTSVDVPNYSGTVISGSPANMQNVLSDAMGHEQSGLISAAAMPGVYRSMSAEDKAILDPKIRPSVKLLFNALNLGGEGSSNATYLGLVGLRADWLFTPGSFDDPQVQSIIAKSSLGKSMPNRPVMVGGNQTDPWMIWSQNGEGLADQYRNNGVDVTTVTTNQPGWPGHKDIGATTQVEWLNQQLPEGSKLTQVTPDKPVSPLSQAVGQIVAPIMDAVGSTVETVVPQISEALDDAVSNTLDQVDTALSASVAPSVEMPAPVNIPQPMATPSASENNVTHIADQAKANLAPEAAPVVDQIASAVASNPQVAGFVNSLPLPFPGR